MSSLLGKVQAAGSAAMALSAGFDFKDDTRPTSELANINLLSPTPCIPRLQAARKSHRIQHEMPMEEYHALKGYYSSSSIATSVRLTEREVAHNLKPEIRAAKSEWVSSSPFVKNGAKIHDLIESIVKRGIKGGNLESHIKRYEPLPKFKLNSKQGVDEALLLLEDKFDAGAIASLKALANEAGETPFQQKKALVQLMIEANPCFVPESTYQYMESLTEELQRLPHILAMLKYAVAEASIFNDEEMTKVRPDVVIPSAVYGRPIHLSVKTTHSLDRFKAAFYSNGLHIQEGMYNHEISLALGEPVVSSFLIIECNAYGLVQCKLEEISDATMLDWHSEYFEAIQRFKDIQCKLQENKALKGYESSQKWGVELM